jgi:ribonuclease R
MRHDNISKRFGTFAAQSASRSTEREIAAMSAERSCEDAYKAEYMAKYIGGEFDGIVSSVTQFGCYVRLHNTIEGLVSSRSLPHGDWQFDGAIALVDTVTGNQIRLGDKMRVKLVAADVSAGRIDFEPLHITLREGKQ